MFIRKLAIIAVVAATTAVSAVSIAETSAARQPCSFDEHQVRSVKPYRMEKRITGRITSNQILGAQLYVAAEPGLTAEWLRLKLERHLATMRGPAAMPDCALDVKNVRVEVASAGPGFNVKLIAQRPEQGKEVLRRAQLLVR
ncbi:MAG TPA: hypothetical protein VI072_35245 [Polyangiaceae bacterium]